MPERIVSSEMQVPEYKGVKLVYVPSPGGKNFSGVISTFIAVLHALAKGITTSLFRERGLGHHAALCRLFGKRSS